MMLHRACDKHLSLTLKTLNFLMKSGSESCQNMRRHKFFYKSNVYHLEQCCYRLRVAGMKFEDQIILRNLKKSMFFLPVYHCGSSYSKLLVLHNWAFRCGATFGAVPTKVECWHFTETWPFDLWFSPTQPSWSKYSYFAFFLVKQCTLQLMPSVDWKNSSRYVSRRHLQDQLFKCTNRGGYQFTGGYQFAK